ncbi:unnamed protein product, partial [marine sediment metagenome]
MKIEHIAIWANDIENFEHSTRNTFMLDRVT